MCRDSNRVAVRISLHHELRPERGAQPLNQLLSGLSTQLLPDAMDDEKRLGHEALILVAARVRARSPCTGRMSCRCSPPECGFIVARPSFDRMTLDVYQVQGSRSGVH